MAVRCRPGLTLLLEGKLRKNAAVTEVAVQVREGLCQHGKGLLKGVLANNGNLGGTGQDSLDGFHRTVGFARGHLVQPFLQLVQRRKQRRMRLLLDGTHNVRVLSNDGQICGVLRVKDGKDGAAEAQAECIMELSLDTRRASNHNPFNHTLRHPSSEAVGQAWCEKACAVLCSLLHERVLGLVTETVETESGLPAPPAPTPRSRPDALQDLGPCVRGEGAYHRSRAVKADDANSAAPTKRAHGITEFLGLKRLPAVVPLAQARPDRRWGLQARLVPLAGEDTHPWTNRTSLVPMGVVWYGRGL